MWEQHKQRWGTPNWIAGAALILAYFAMNLFFPSLDTRWKLLAALAVAAVVSAVIYVLKKKKKDKEEENKLPPV